MGLTPGKHDGYKNGLHDHRQNNIQPNLEDAAVIKALETGQCVLHHLVETRDLDKGMDDDTPGVQRIGGSRRQCACQADNECHLHRSGEGLPPDKYLPKLDAFFWIFDPVFG